MSITDFTEQMISDPTLMTIIVMTFIVVLINGWKDAPHTIFTSVFTGALNTKNAVILVTCFNFLGVVIMTSLCGKVAETIWNMVSFTGSYGDGLIALSAALISVVVWILVANHYKLPTSETHALVAGITVAAIAVTGGISAINSLSWAKVILGIIISLFLAFAVGWVIIKGIGILFRHRERKDALEFFQHAQIFSVAGNAFMHGAQDGQKFIGIFLIAIYLEEGKPGGQDFVLPVWLIIISAILLSAGTAIGGIRIQRSTGLQKTKVENYQGFSADLATSLTLLLSSLAGIPISTNHTKISAILGVESAKGLFSINSRAQKAMLASLSLTYIGCGIISMIVTLLFLKIF